MRPVFFAILSVACLGGCSSALETGYVPRKLNATEEDRRAFYAARYSPESRVDKQKQEGPPPTPPRWK